MAMSNDPKDSVASAEESAAVSEISRKPYHAPVLTSFGEVTEVTMKSGNSFDGGSSNRMN